MKKIAVLVFLVFAVVLTASAQKYAYINSDSILNSLPEFKSSMSKIEAKGKEYQKIIDDEFAQIEKMFNNYQLNKEFMSESSRRSREKEIIDREKKITEYQKTVFGQTGDMVKYQAEILEPLQKMVQDAVDRLAQTDGYDIIFDTANGGGNMIFKSPKLDKTKDVLKLLGY